MKPFILLIFYDDDDEILLKHDGSFPVCQADWNESLHSHFGVHSKWLIQSVLVSVRCCSLVVVKYLPWFTIQTRTECWKNWGEGTLSKLAHWKGDHQSLPTKELTFGQRGERVHSLVSGHFPEASWSLVLCLIVEWARTRSEGGTVPNWLLWSGYFLFFSRLVGRREMYRRRRDFLSRVTYTCNRKKSDTFFRGIIKRSGPVEDDSLINHFSTRRRRSLLLTDCWRSNWVRFASQHLVKQCQLISLIGFGQSLQQLSGVKWNWIWSITNQTNKSVFTRNRIEFACWSLLFELFFFFFRFLNLCVFHWNASTKKELDANSLIEQVVHLQKERSN